MKLANNIKRLCKERGLSLARLAKDAGVPPQTLHNWTTGRRSIDPAQLKRIAAELEVSIHQLLFNEPDPFESRGEEILKEIFSGDVRVTLHRIEKKNR